MVDTLLSFFPRRHSRDRMNTPPPLVEMSEEHGAEVHRPAAVVDLEQADVLSTERMTHTQTASAPGERAALPDTTDHVCGWIRHGRHLRGIRPGRRHIEVCGRLLPQRLMRPLLIVGT